MAPLFFRNLPSSKAGLPKIFKNNEELLHRAPTPFFNPQSFLLAFLCISLLMISNVRPAQSVRRIQNDPYQTWDTIPRDYEYIDLEDQDVAPEVPPVPRRQHPHHQSRPPVSHHNYPSAPQPIAFGGQFHITRDRFVPFVASDVVLDQPVTPNPQPVVHPKPKAIPFVPSAVQAYPPETTSEPSFIYYTPSTVYYVTTRSPTLRPNPETFVERKRERFYSNNETETFVVNGQKPNAGHHSATTDTSYQENKHVDTGSDWKKPSDFSSYNKLTATEVQSPVTEFPRELTTTSQAIDFQRTFKPNTLYPYPTDRIRSGSEYRPSNPVVRQHSRNNLNAESETTDRAIVTSEQPVTEHPFQEKEKSKRRLSSGAIAGIAVGILAPLALVAGALSLLLRLCLHKRRGVFILRPPLQNSSSQRSK